MMPNQGIVTVHKVWDNKSLQNTLHILYVCEFIYINVY